MRAMVCIALMTSLAMSVFVGTASAESEKTEIDISGLWAVTYHSCQLSSWTYSISEGKKWAFGPRSCLDGPVTYEKYVTQSGNEISMSEDGGQFGGTISYRGNVTGNLLSFSAHDPKGYRISGDHYPTTMYYTGRIPENFSRCFYKNYSFEIPKIDGVHSSTFHRQVGDHIYHQELEGTFTITMRCPGEEEEPIEPSPTPIEANTTPTEAPPEEEHIEPSQGPIEEKTTPTEAPPETKAPVKEPDVPDDVNYCGGKGSVSVPRHWFGADFNRPCYNHDKCYDEAISSRKKCDKQFLIELNKECYSANSRILLCSNVAKLYHWSVRAAGWLYYNY